MPVVVEMVANKFGLEETGGPQPPGGGGPQFVPELASTPQAASRIGWLDGCRSFAP